MLAIVFSCEKFRSYILGSHVIIHSNHATVKYLMEKEKCQTKTDQVGFDACKNLIGNKGQEGEWKCDSKLFSVNYICSLSVIFMYFYNPNALFTPIHQYYTNSPFCNVLHNVGPKDVYKFMTLSPKDYYLIPGNGAIKLVGPHL